MTTTEPRSVIHTCPTCKVEVAAWACRGCGADWTKAGRVLALYHAAITAGLIQTRTGVRPPKWLRGVLDVCHVAVFDHRHSLGLTVGITDELERLARRLRHYGIRLTTQEPR